MRPETLIYRAAANNKRQRNRTKNGEADILGRNGSRRIDYERMIICSGADGFDEQHYGAIHRCRR